MYRWINLVQNSVWSLIICMEKYTHWKQYIHLIDFNKVHIFIFNSVTDLNIMVANFICYRCVGGNTKLFYSVRRNNFCCHLRVKTIFFCTDRNNTNFCDVWGNTAVCWTVRDNSKFCSALGGNNTFFCSVGGTLNYALSG